MEPNWGQHAWRKGLRENALVAIALLFGVLTFGLLSGVISIGFRVLPPTPDVALALAPEIEPTVTPAFVATVSIVRTSADPLPTIAAQRPITQEPSLGAKSELRGVEPSPTAVRGPAAETPTEKHDLGNQNAQVTIEPIVVVVAPPTPTTTRADEIAQLPNVPIDSVVQPAQIDASPATGSLTIESVDSDLSSASAEASRLPKTGGQLPRSPLGALGVLLIGVGLALRRQLAL